MTSHVLLDRTIDGVPLAEVGQAAATAEVDGAGAVWLGEVNSDPFLPMVPAASATTRLELGTSVAIAFARSPMTVATTAYELQAHSQGRFVLGLGTQVRAHITRRFGMPWSSPAARMREYVEALHTIWDAWLLGGELRFEGEFYQYTLMPPMFRPPPHGYGHPRVMIAGVGPRLVHVAAEVGDGLFVHPFTSPEYLAGSVLPAFDEGMRAGGRSRDQLTLACALLTATGQDDESRGAAREAARRQLAFYASTPAYAAVLEAHGWGAAQPELAGLVREGRWAELAALVTDEMLSTFALVGTPSEVGVALQRRWGGVLDRASLVAPLGVDRASWLEIRAAAESEAAAMGRLK